MNNLLEIKKELNNAADPEKAKILQRFFKTAPGEYGHGDIFLGIIVPIQRKIASKYIDLNFSDIQKLLNSKIHEHRFCALAILVSKYKKASDPPAGGEKKKIFNFYIKNSKKINNWDLVDTSTPQIVGEYLLDKNRAILYKLARSKNLWQKRIAVLATFSFIRKNEFEDILKISKILIKDEHHLIHKAVGWMLREVGKRNKIIETNFIKANHRKMPHIMLSYALEKYSRKEKEAILI